MAELEEYSRDGPKCPHCKHQHKPDDEGYDYDEDGRRVDCSACGKKFRSHPHISYSWSTCSIDDIEA